MNDFELSYQKARLSEHKYPGSKVPRQIAVRKRASKLDTIEEDNIHTTVDEIIKVLEDRSKNISSEFTTLFTPFVKNKRAMTRYRDQYDLDILHYSIFANRPEAVKWLLNEDYFESSHKPEVNPYAHLAAFLGQCQNLNTILSHRPQDYFVTSTSKHAIIIPAEVIRRFKIPDEKPSDRRNRAKHKLMEKIYLEAVHLSNEDDSTILELENEIKGLEKLGDRRFHFFPKKVTNSISTESRAVVVKNRESSVGPATKITQTSLISDKESKQSSSFTKASKPEKKVKHKITLHREIFSGKNGVLGGAGEPVALKKQYTSDKELPLNYEHDSADSLRSVFSFGNDIASKSRNLTEKSKSQISVSKSVSKSSTVKKDSNTELMSQKRLKGSSRDSMSQSSINRKIPGKNYELGIRGSKKYKTFELHIESRTLPLPFEKKFMHKSPLALAAERGHVECVQQILTVLFNKKSGISNANALYAAVNADSPESVILLLENRVTRDEYQVALLQSIRQHSTKCLIALLSRKKHFANLFDKKNLFHLLYTQTLALDKEKDRLVDMTRILIENKEDVNDHTVSRTYPLYTLINCAFSSQCYSFTLHCLSAMILLLEAKANPHFDEKKHEDKRPSSKSFARPAYRSAIHCIVQSAKRNVTEKDNKYWTYYFTKNFFSKLEAYDSTPRQTLNYALFSYVGGCLELGFDRQIIKTLLRYGANPDFNLKGNYAVNLYFDLVLPFLAKFEVVDSYYFYSKEVENLMLIVEAMDVRSKHDLRDIFLDRCILHTPLQGLPIVRYFAYHMDRELRNPAPLTKITSNFIWKLCQRNIKLAFQLPISSALLSLIIP